MRTFEAMIGLDSEDLEMIKDISGKEEVTDKETEE